jgi:hypothetical protein
MSIFPKNKHFKVLKKKNKKKTVFVFHSQILKRGKFRKKKNSFALSSRQIELYRCYIPNYSL